MSRFYLITVFLLGIVVIFVATVAFLAYGYAPKRSGELTVAGLEEMAAIGWSEDGIPWIQANSAADAAASLGYVHAIDQTESIVLWRQAALGKLNAWEGARAVPLDLFARRLGFERIARAAFQDLQEEDRRRLEAYVAGINRALETPGVRQKEALIRQRIKPERWEPWHPLAVERLLSYLATPPLRLDSMFQAFANRDSIVTQFVETDSLFRATLGLWGWQHGRAYGTSEGIVLHQPLGNSALPVLSQSVLHIAGERTVLGTVPGTLMTPFGSTDNRSWAIILSGRTSLEPVSDSIPSPTFERLVAANGNETLIRLIRDESGLILNPRSGWRLTWHGFRTATDAVAWRTIATPGSPLPSFSLIRGAGILRDGDRLQVIGAPFIQSQTTNHAFASEHPTAASAAHRLQSVQDASIRELAQDTRSPWAVSQITPLLQSLRSSNVSTHADALTFLQGWDFHYSTNDVSPALFERWLKAIDEVIKPVAVDSVLTDWRLPLTLRLGAARVEDTQGDSESDWRWQQTFTNQLTPPFGNPNWTCRPFSIPEGHPTSLLPGPSLYLKDPPGPAVWSSWISFGSAQNRRSAEQNRSFDDASWSIRRPICAPEIPPTTPIQTIDLQSDPEYSLRLIPARQ